MEKEHKQNAVTVVGVILFLVISLFLLLVT